MSAGPELELRTKRGAMLYDASCIDQPGDELFEPAHWKARGALEEQPGGRGTVAFVRSLAVIVDVTARRALEEERPRAQKLESIDTLAGGIAHDFNNLLQGVFGYISMAWLAAERPQESLAMLAQAEQALHQAVSLTSQLLTFAKGGRPLKQVIALRPVIEDAVREGDSAARIGGEEFALWLPGGSLKEGLAGAERVRSQIQELGWEWQGRPWPLAASVGVAAWPETTRSRDNLISQADAARTGPSQADGTGWKSLHQPGPESQVVYFGGSTCSRLG